MAEIVDIRDKVKVLDVTIPDCEEHGGQWWRNWRLRWVCPVCGKPRGEPKTIVNTDSKNNSIYCHAWTNPCGHADTYEAVRKEVRENGLNGDRLEN